MKAIYLALAGVLIASFSYAQTIVDFDNNTGCSYFIEIEAEAVQNACGTHLATDHNNLDPNSSWTLSTDGKNGDKHIRTITITENSTSSTVVLNVCSSVLSGSGSICGGGGGTFTATYTPSWDTVIIDP